MGFLIDAASTKHPKENRPLFKGLLVYFRLNWARSGKTDGAEHTQN